MLGFKVSRCRVQGRGFRFAALVVQNLGGVEHPEGLRGVSVVSGVGFGLGFETKTLEVTRVTLTPG